VIDAVPSEAAQISAAVTTTGATVKVAADERIEAPKGETYYKLQADKNGVETLEAVKPASDLKDASLLAQQNAQAPVPGAAATASAADAASNAAFAERVAQIQAMVDKADVGKQVVVQMQPLLAEGGGTVRINLHPKDLGQITVDLKVMDGKVQGTIAASEPAVVEQLARELHSLRHGLADAGLKLGEQGINLMLSNQGQNGQGGQNGRDAQNAQAQAGRGFGSAVSGSGNAAGDDLASNLAAWVAPDRMLDVNV
jgi:flagellar hook-length control protein FliK